jgi:anti-sigma B factor antagonist
LRIHPSPVPRLSGEKRSNVLKTMKFELNSTEIGTGEFVIGLNGDVDLYTAPELKSELHRLIDAGATRIIVDLTSATFIDSTTLGVLLGALKRFRPTGGELVLVCSDPNIRRIFEITLLDRVFAIFGTRESAIEFPPASSTT